MQWLAQHRGRLLFYLLFGVIPFVLWVIAPDQQLVFTSPYTFLTTAGKAAGIIGLCFYAGNLLLTGRYRFLDRLFKGLDRTYLFHRQTGIITFILLSAHVVFIIGRFLFEFTEFFWPVLLNYTDITTGMGRISYAGLFIIICLTLYSTFYTGKRFRLKLKYETLKYLHSYLGLFLFFGGLHAYLIPSDIAQNLALQRYSLGVVAIALISYLVRTVFKRWLVRRISAEVKQVTKLNSTVTEVTFEPKGGRGVSIVPGQFIFIKFKQKGFPYEEHPFSLTCSQVEAEQGKLRISAKNLGDFTGQLSTLRPGAQALVQGPFGGFSFQKHTNKRQVWIAGGIGITPFMSMSRTVRDMNIQDYNTHLIYTTVTEEEMVYKKELEDIAGTHPHFVFTPWLSDKGNFLTAEKVKNIVPDIFDRDIFICGPRPMLESLKKQFVALGIQKQRIHFELFKLL